MVIPVHLPQEALVTTAVVHAFSQGLQWHRAVTSLSAAEVDGYTLSAAILGCGSPAMWDFSPWKMVMDGDGVSF